MSKPEAKRRRLLSICEQDYEIKGFLTSPEITQELVLFHLLHEIETWLYRVAWLPLEVMYKKDLGWFNNHDGPELKLNVYISLQNYWGCWPEEEERLNMFLLYWQRPCRVVVDCSWPVTCNFTGKTQHVVMDDDSWFMKITGRIPTEKLVLDYSDVFYENGWGWRDPSSYVVRRMTSRLKRFNGRRKQRVNHHM